MAKRTYEKHLAFYKMRDELRKARCCALCCLERKGMHQFFDGLLHEKVTDPGIRGSLVKSAGFCPRHAHILVGFGDGLGTAILYADRPKLHLQALRKFSSPTRNRRVPQPFLAQQENPCTACRMEEQVRSGHVHTLIQGLTDPEMVEAFISSVGPCFPHFSVVTSRAEDPAMRSLLIRVQREKLENLAASLKQFVDKHDYRRTSEGFAEEKDSWLRAVEFVSGMKNVF